MDALVVRRRVREKSTIKKVEENDEEEVERKEEEKKRVNLLRFIEQEMRLMVEDDASLALEEMKLISSLKKMAEKVNEEEEILQTRIVSQREVSENWKDWTAAAQSEVESMLKEKEAFREIFPEELQQMKEAAAQTGREIEFIPSKLVFTKKPGPAGGRKKMRWVICGNWESRREDEESFSSGADAAALRILTWCAPLHQWSALTLDVRTAFLNAKLVQNDDEPLIIAKPPTLLVDKCFLRKDVFYLPEKAVYGLRRSPRLWGVTRDETISTFDIQAEHQGKLMNFHLCPLQSEPNLWRLLNSDDVEDEEMYGLLMTYVDDIFIASTPKLMEALHQKDQKHLVHLHARGDLPGTHQVFGHGGFEREG